MRAYTSAPFSLLVGSKKTLARPAWLRGAAEPVRRMLKIALEYLG